MNFFTKLKESVWNKENDACLKNETPLESKENLKEAIFINTLPKSGSMYINTSIIVNFNTSQMRGTSGGWPCSILSVYMLDEFLLKKKLIQEHADASETNINTINAMLDRFVLHIRDPREAVNSWIHHEKRFAKKRIQKGYYVNLLEHSPTIPFGYHEWSLERQTDFIVKNYYKGFLDWILAWLSAIDESLIKTDILVTEYSQLHNNEEEFMRKLLRFYGIEHDNIKLPEKNIDTTHFRSGKKEGWKEWSQENIDYANALLPDWLAKKYGWNK